MAKISVIIKTKNSENTLCETLESVKTLDEIIILDEHSKDDTIEIAKTYKAKIIYVLAFESNQGFCQALNEASGDWIFVVEDDEIIPKNLISKIKNLTEKPKKNRNGLSFEQKTFYLNKEIKSEKKEVLRLFKKENCTLNLSSGQIELNEGKIYKIKENENCAILKFQNKDIISKTIDSFVYCKSEIKNSAKKPNFFKPLKTFFYFYFIKRAFLDKSRGFIYAFLKMQKEFVIQTMIFEKFEREKNDIIKTE